MQCSIESSATLYSTYTRAVYIIYYYTKLCSFYTTRGTLHSKFCSWNNYIDVSYARGTYEYAQFLISTTARATVSAKSQKSAKIPIRINCVSVYFDQSVSSDTFWFQTLLVIVACSLLIAPMIRMVENLRRRASSWFQLELEFPITRCQVSISSVDCEN